MPADRAVIQEINSVTDVGQFEETASMQCPDMQAEKYSEYAELPNAAGINDAEIPHHKPGPVAAAGRQKYSRLFVKLLQGASP